MVFVRIREAKEEDCGNILRLIRVKFAGQKPGSQSVVAGGVGEEAEGREEEEGEEEVGAWRGGGIRGKRWELREEV